MAYRLGVHVKVDHLLRNSNAWVTAGGTWIRNRSPIVCLHNYVPHCIHTLLGWASGKGSLEEVTSVRFAGDALILFYSTRSYSVLNKNSPPLPYTYTPLLLELQTIHQERGLFSISRYQCATVCYTWHQKWLQVGRK